MFAKAIRLAGISFGIVLLSGCKPDSQVLGKHVFSVNPQDISSRSELSCQTIVDVAAWQEDPQNVNEISVKITKGSDKLALAIHEDYVTLITATAVENGIAEPERWAILVNNDQFLSAGHLRNGELLYSFTLNKKSGLAMWSKVSPSFLWVQAPDGFIQYLKCN